MNNIRVLFIVAALPALFNQFIISVKDTALLSAIAVNEITHQAQAYAALSFKAIPTYTALAAFYLVILFRQLS